MLWLKLLHIAAVIVWCGTLLYLPLAIASAGDDGVHARLAERGVVRALFTHVVTPAALLAIGSGSAIFLLRGPLEPWLLAKLVLVALLVLAHGACGLLILRREQRSEASATAAAPNRCIACGAVLSASLLLLTGVAWLVLHKPMWPA